MDETFNWFRTWTPKIQASDFKVEIINCNIGADDGDPATWKARFAAALKAIKEQCPNLVVDEPPEMSK